MDAVQITVKVRAEHAAALQTGAPGSAEAKALSEDLRERGVTLTPLHPRTDDTTLASWFTAEVDESQVNEILNTLSSYAAVEAAYVKPAEEPP